jgi:hypothetical protein
MTLDASLRSTTFALAVTSGTVVDRRRLSSRRLARQASST